MATARPSMRRRTLRPTNALDLVEASLTRSGAGDGLTVEIAGGPPGMTATLRLGGVDCHRVRLDGCGAGVTQVTALPSDPSVEILVGDQVLLTGRLPVAP